MVIGDVVDVIILRASGDEYLLSYTCNGK